MGMRRKRHRDKTTKPRGSPLSDRAGVRDSGYGALSRGMSLGDRLEPGVRLKLVEMARRLDVAAKAIERQSPRPWLTLEGKKDREVKLPPSQELNSVPIVGMGSDEPEVRRTAPTVDNPRNAKPEPISVTKASAKEKVRSEEPQIWTLSDAYAVRRNASPVANDIQRDEFQQILIRGVAAFGQKGAHPIFPVIGLDFGTSSTKAIVQLYGEQNDPAFAVEMPSWALSDNNVYLWQTFLGCSDDGILSPWLEAGAIPIDNLKTGVIFEPATRLVGTGTARPTFLETMTAYLAYVIRYVRGWMLTRHREAFTAREVIWSVNVGLPAEKADSAALALNYRRASVAALLLADSGLSITTQSCSSTINRRDVQDLAKSDESLLARGISVVPEVAAEVAGWARTTKRQDGLYAMIDIGAATLDICTFRLNKNELGDDRYSILTAEVRPFGVEAEVWFAREGKASDEFQYQCAWQRNRVIWSTARTRDSKARCWATSETLPVFVCGGGAANALHRRVVDNLGPWLKQFVSNSGANILVVEKPRQLEMHGDAHAFGRLAVAWGLSYPRLLIGEIVPPSAIDDLAALPVRDLGANYISKDFV